MNDFWQMVWEADVHIIVMVTSLNEGGMVIVTMCFVYVLVSLSLSRSSAINTGQIRDRSGTTTFLSNF